MASANLTTLGIGPKSDPASIMLAKLFPTWRGDASEPTIPAPAPTRPAPAAAEMAVA
ncbi:hypothetical protein [Phenylobacterium sp.]|uniref:hypothetical protein n=1 Tax=Phenylobacterium sp. TaxID=1871053 RepID=UPI00286D6C70|nr:hypothetical protein [Phenylobacterium sp.]